MESLGFWETTTCLDEIAVETDVGNNSATHLGGITPLCLVSETSTNSAHATEITLTGVGRNQMTESINVDQITR